MLAMVVNDNAGRLTPRVVLGFFASKLAPTGYGVYLKTFDREITSGDPPVFLYQANTKYLRTVSTTSQVPFIPGSMTKISPARRWIGAMPSGVMTQ